MTKQRQEPLFDDLPDISDLEGFATPEAVFVTYDDLKDQRIILFTAVEEWGEFGRYYKVELKRANSDNLCYMNVGASQPVEMIDNVLAKSKLPAKAKFVKQGRTWLLVGWAYNAKR